MKGNPNALYVWGFLNLFEFMHVISSVLYDLARFHNQNAMPVFHLRLLWQRVF